VRDYPTATVEGSQTVQVVGNQALAVQGNQTEQVSGSARRTITGVLAAPEGAVEVPIALDVVPWGNDGALCLLSVALAEQGLSVALGMRLRRVWARRVAADSALGKQLARAIQELDRSS